MASGASQEHIPIKLSPRQLVGVARRIHRIGGDWRLNLGPCVLRLGRARRGTGGEHVAEGRDEFFTGGGSIKLKFG